MPASQCMAARVMYNSAKNAELKAKKDAEAACPDETRNETIEATTNENLGYVKLKSQELKQATNQFNRLKTIVHRFTEIAKPTTEYLQQLDTTIETAEKDTRQYSQTERTRRRKFLDDSPQSGVFGLPGIRTYDDKVLLAFWITYGVAILGIMAIAFHFQPSLSFTQKLKYAASGLLVAYGVAYYMITKFA